MAECEMASTRNLKLEGFEEDVVVDAAYDGEVVDVPEYWITSFGIDYDVAGIVRRMNNGDIEIPAFQRGLVWDKARASRFIESLLLRLPVPGIFLYREGDSQKQQVIDGQQRLLSLCHFYSGRFKGKLFTLTGLRTRFNGMQYSDLSHADRRKLDDAIIHATIIRQDKPDDGGSSQYALFERINTTATPLTPQEIRASIYPGAFSQLLADLNENLDWRLLFGTPHKRRRDEELILRFFALYYCGDNYWQPMKGFLNTFMSKNRALESLSPDEMRDLFEKTVGAIRAGIGPKAFKLHRAVNAALYDAVMVGVARRLATHDSAKDFRYAYEHLINDNVFTESLDVRTSNEASVEKRLRMATDAFADAV